MRRGPVSVAAYWAGAAHPRRQKHREMPPPGASAPAFAATVEPTFTQNTSDIPPTYLQRDSSINACWGMGCCLHRFLISDLDLRIDAGFCLFMPSCVHRFLISSPDLGIDAGFCLFTPSFVHRFLISGPDLGIDAGFCLFTPSFVHRFLISGGQFGNRCKLFPSFGPSAAVILDFRPRLGNRCSVIAAAVRNGPPATAVVAAIFRVRFYSSLPQWRTARLLRA